MSDNDFRSAVGLLNTFRLRRVENLGGGYDVSDSIPQCIATPNTFNSVPRRNRFHPNRQERHCQLHARYDVSAIDLNIPEFVEKFNVACSTASAKYDNLATSTRAEVEKALAGRDTSESDLRASFRRAFAFSIPPPTLYRNYCPGAHSESGLIFGVPLVDVETNQDNVPDVMRICIEEVEKRGLDTKGIYSVSQSCMYQDP